MHMVQVGQRMGRPICPSARPLDELDRTPDADQRADLLAYGAQLVDLESEDAPFSSREVWTQDRTMIRGGRR